MPKISCSLVYIHPWMYACDFVNVVSSIDHYEAPIERQDCHHDRLCVEGDAIPVLSEMEVHLLVPPSTHATCSMRMENNRWQGKLTKVSGGQLS